MLYSLQIALIVKDDMSGRAQHYSEFPTLTGVLTRSKRLKVLRIRFKHVYFEEDCTKLEEGDLNFHVNARDTMPALSVLEVPHKLHWRASDHTLRWLNSTDWSTLTFLDLGHTVQGVAFERLNGVVPNLKGLTIGFHSHPDVIEYFRCDPTVVKSFIEAIHALEELRIFWPLKYHWPILWPSTLKKHGPSLRKLEVSFMGPSTVDGWYNEQLQDLLVHAPALEELTIELKLFYKTPQYWVC